MKKCLVYLLFLSGLASNSAFAGGDHVLAVPSFNADTAPHKVLFIPPHIEVKELATGGISERVDEWSEQAKANLLASLAKANLASPVFDLVDVPELTGDEKNKLDEHVALFDLVGGNAYHFGKSASSAWKHKQTAFDYTLGDGLSFLAERSGADAALIIVGEDYISTGGRKAARIAAALLGVILPPSPTLLAAAVIDLKTGDVLWMNYDLYLDSKNMRDPGDWDTLVNSLLKDYPRQHGS